MEKIIYTIIIIFAVLAIIIEAQRWYRRRKLENHLKEMNEYFSNLEINSIEIPKKKTSVPKTKTKTKTKAKKTKKKASK